MAPRKPESSSLGNIQTLGVISLIGDKLQEQHVGFTKQSKEPVYHDVSEWNVDGYVYEIIAKRLSSYYQIVSLNYNSSQFEKVYVDGLFRSIDLSLIQRELAELHKDSGVDGFLIVTYSPFHDPIGQARLMLNRYGIYDRRVFRRTIAGYAGIKINLIKGISLEPLASWRSFRHEILDSRLADDFNQMSIEEKELVKQAIFNSLQNAVAEILTDMALLRLEPDLHSEDHTKWHILNFIYDQMVMAQCCD